MEGFQISKEISKLYLCHRRRLLGTILTVYIPTLLLIIISHMTNYFKSFFFEAVVTVNLTVMLVGVLPMT